MSSSLRIRFDAGARLRRTHAVVCAFALLGLLFVAGCNLFHREPPRPGRTELRSATVTVPATMMSSYLVVESKWDKRGPYHFLIDTGAAVTLVSPDLAARYAAKDAPPPDTPQVRVKAADGGTALLSPTTLKRLDLGGARFENVPALIYDCSALSAHLGMQIDGILGFPLFRETLLTLDYPHSQIILRPREATSAIQGTPISFNNDRKTPIIPLRLGDDTFVALIDSGSDTSLSLNPVGLQPVYALQPRTGATVATLSGDREQLIGRSAQTLMIGDYPVEKPIVELTDELTSIGGRLLKYFTVTFDQEHSQVTFYRDTHTPVLPTPFRHAGISFTKTPAYWRVIGVIPDSPAAAAGVQPGDLVTRINGEPVAQWNIVRYQQMIDVGGEVSFTFLNGTKETEKRFAIFDLVP